MFIYYLLTDSIFIYFMINIYSLIQFLQKTLHNHIHTRYKLFNTQTPKHVYISSKKKSILNYRIAQQNSSVNEHVRIYAWNYGILLAWIIISQQFAMQPNHWLRFSILWSSPNDWQDIFCDSFALIFAGTLVMMVCVDKWICEYKVSLLWLYMYI